MFGFFPQNKHCHEVFYLHVTVRIEVKLDTNEEKMHFFCFVHSYGRADKGPLVDMPLQGFPSREVEPSLTLGADAKALYKHVIVMKINI